jgi:hypothetical protein
LRLGKTVARLELQCNGGRAVPAVHDAQARAVPFGARGMK